MDNVEQLKSLKRFGSILGLDRITVLMDKLGNPQDKIKIIHIAGTNGKGSVSRYIYQVLCDLGYKTGIYTSPFLEKFNERIETDEGLISDEDIEIYSSRVMDKVDEMVKEGLESPTEFDVVTAMAFLYFYEKGVQWLVLEVGLGGRGDSTNVVRKPKLTVFTSISYDHMDRLGNTIEDISREKAGILKGGVPAICGVKNKTAFEVIRAEAEELKAPFIDATSRDRKLLSMYPKGMSVELDGTKMELSMVGIHQMDNCTTAKVALETLREKGEIDFKDSELGEALGKAKINGRFEVMSGPEPWVIIDGAHNEDSVSALAETCSRIFKDKKILFVVGVLRDKDIDKMMDIFLSVSKDTAVAKPDNERACESEELVDIIRAKNGNVVAYDNDSAALLDKVDKVKSRYDVIIYAGSLYFIGDIRRKLYNI